jgi:UDP-N-acetylglucosamine 1-carboxyvinyltransferase
MAEGETCVTGAGFISRGYEHICEDLRTLGCRIWQPGTEDLRIYERK